MMIAQGPISIKVEETDAAVTNYPGAVPLANLAHRLGVLDDLDRLLPPKERARGFAHSAAVFDLMGIAWSGGSCIDDLAQLRGDRGLARLLGREVMAPSTAHEYLRRIRYDGLDALATVRRRLLALMAKAASVTTATLDCDASLFVSGGRDARMSYKGERGYMPMLAFWEELGAVVHDDFRHGHASPNTDPLGFLKETVAQLPPAIEQIFVRSDSAWYQADLLDHCHDSGHGFCIGADKDEAVRAAIQGLCEDNWQRLALIGEPGDPEPFVREEAQETVHTLNNSAHPYRLIVIRKERLQDDLFYGPYHYHVLITNMEMPLEEQIAWYRRRGQCENQIGELKWDFELRTLPSGDFFVNALYLRIMTLAYNLFIALKRMVLPADYRTCRLKTLRFRLLGIPALVVRHARRLILKLPRGHPHLEAFSTACA